MNSISYLRKTRREKYVPVRDIAEYLKISKSDVMAIELGDKIPEEGLLEKWESYLRERK